MKNYYQLALIIAVSSSFFACGSGGSGGLEKSIMDAVRSTMPLNEEILEFKDIELGEVQPTQTMAGVVNFQPFTMKVKHIGEKKFWFSMGDKLRIQHPKKGRRNPISGDWVYSQPGVILTAKGRAGTHEGGIMYDPNGNPMIESLVFEINQKDCDMNKLRKALIADLKKELPSSKYSRGFMTYNFHDDTKATFSQSNTNSTCTGSYNVLDQEHYVAVKISCPNQDIEVITVANYLASSPSILPDMDGGGWTVKQN